MREIMPPLEDKPRNKNRKSFKNKLVGFATAAVFIASCNLADSDDPQGVDSGIITGIDIMNQTKDRIDNPRSRAEKELLVQYAKELGIKNVSLATPYEFYTNEGEVKSHEAAINETREWISVIREAGLSVTHRHMFMNMEGIYDNERVTNSRLSQEFGKEYLQLMREWMISNEELIQPGDVWTPFPEPQNAGIKGANCTNDCFFESPDEFNRFIREAVMVSRKALEEMEKGNVEVVCCGFDGYIAWGDNNPDRKGQSFLEPETVTALGHVAIDHYPKSGSTYREDLDELHRVWPGIPVYITEFGVIRESPDIEKAFQTFSEDKLIKGVWYWQLGPAGPEALIELNKTDVSTPEHEILLTPEDIEKTGNYKKVKKGFAGLQ